MSDIPSDNKSNKQTRMLFLYRSFLRGGGRPSKCRLLDRITIIIPPKQRCLVAARPWRIVGSSHFASSTRSSSSKRSAADQHTNSQKPQPPPSATSTTEKSSNSNARNTTTTSDPPVLTWVETALPKALIPYARLARIDKPIGTMLLVSSSCRYPPTQLMLVSFVFLATKNDD
jgi:hypothetical protein